VYQATAHALGWGGTASAVAKLCMPARQAYQAEKNKKKS